MRHRIVRTGTLKTGAGLLRAFAALVILLAGCAASDRPAERFTDLLDRFPQSPEPLRIERLSASSADAVPPAPGGRAATIIVHPAYALFFRQGRRSASGEAKFDLLRFQLENEARFISEIAKTENLLILVLPGNYQTDSLAPLSYTFFLNSSTRAGPLVFYISSETSNSGSLKRDTMATLSGFLQSVNADKVLIGGGYIGRCQREFYDQLTTTMDTIPAYIVPELSSISPDDIDDDEAQEIVKSLQQRNFAPVRKFIEQKGKGRDNVPHMPSGPVL